MSTDINENVTECVKYVVIDKKKSIHLTSGEIYTSEHETSRSLSTANHHMKLNNNMQSTIS